MIDSGLTKLGIVNPQMLTKERYTVENAAILDELVQKTTKVLEQYRVVFEQSLAILLKEEVLSGEQFRSLMDYRTVEAPV
jgi:ATP-dependent Zn protease